MAEGPTSAEDAAHPYAQTNVYLNTFSTPP